MDSKNVTNIYARIWRQCDIINHRIQILLVLSFVVLHGLAQATDNTLYIYRNDGQFNAFFCNEVDSITFTDVDINGIRHNELVTQKIWTADSVYLIPIEVIDSVSFYAPETIINNNVFPLTFEHTPYIIQSEQLWFVLSKTTPAQMRPHVGNIVVSDIDCLSFNNGIIARVVQITEKEDGILYECEKAYIDDVYDQVVFYGDALANDNSSDIRNNIQNRASVNLNCELWNIPFDHKWNNSGTETHVSATDKTKLRLTICKTFGKPLYAKIDIVNEIQSTINFSAESETSIAPDPVQLGKTISIGRIRFPQPFLRFFWIEPQLKLYGYFEDSGKVSLNINTHLNRVDEVSMIYSEGEWKMNHAANNDFGVDVANISLDGSAEVGLIPELLFSLNGTQTGIGVKTKIGIKQSANLLFDVLQFSESGVYDAIKDSKTQTYRTQSVSLFAQAGLFTEVSARGELEILKSEKMIANKFFLPSFTLPEYTINRDELTVSSNASHSLICPCNIGFRLYEQDRIKETYWDGQYGENGESQTQFSTTFSGIKYNNNYKVCPIIKLFGKEIEASPLIDVDNDLKVYTVSATASKSDAYCNGKISTSDGSMSRVIADIDECGFFYNLTGSPRNGNSMNQTCSVGDQGYFSTFITGLTEETQYYCTAYVKIGEDYFYGDTQQFVTLKDKEPGSVSGDSIRRWNERAGYCLFWVQTLYGLSEGSYDMWNLWMSISSLRDIVSVSLENGYYEEAEEAYLEYLPLENRVKELVGIYYPGMWDAYYPNKQLVFLNKLKSQSEITSYIR